MTPADIEALRQVRERVEALLVELKTTDRNMVVEGLALAYAARSIQKIIARLNISAYSEQYDRLGKVLAEIA